MHGACQMRIPLQRDLRRAAVAAATGSVVFCRPSGTNRFMLAPRTNERDPYGQAAGAVRAVVKELKELRTSACVAVVAPLGTDQKAIPGRKLLAFKEQVRVRKQLGSFPEIVTVKVAYLRSIRPQEGNNKVAGDIDMKVVSSINTRDPLCIEMTKDTICAIKQMVQALQRVPTASHQRCSAETSSGSHRGWHRR